MQRSSIECLHNKTSQSENGHDRNGNAYGKPLKMAACMHCQHQDGVPSIDSGMKGGVYSHYSKLTCHF